MNTTGGCLQFAAVTDDHRLHGPAATADWHVLQPVHLRWHGWQRGEGSVWGGCMGGWVERKKASGPERVSATPCAQSCVQGAHASARHGRQQSPGEAGSSPQGSMPPCPTRTMCQRHGWGTAGRAGLLTRSMPSSTRPNTTWRPLSLQAQATERGRGGQGRLGAQGLDIHANSRS